MNIAFYSTNHRLTAMALPCLMALLLVAPGAYALDSSQIVPPVVGSAPLRAATAGYANNAGHADTSGYANNAGQLGGYDLNWVRNNGIYAGSANSANTANSANYANYANTANSANSANTANSANSANTANYADAAGRATRADTAIRADEAAVAIAAASQSRFIGNLYTRYAYENAGYPDCGGGTVPVLTHTGWDFYGNAYYQYLCLSVR